jgi:hypothetical protein
MDRNSLRTIFAEAMEIQDSPRRAAYLEHTCGIDPELRKEVEELIKASEEASTFLPEQPALVASAAVGGAVEARNPGGGLLPNVLVTEKPGTA